MNKYDNIKLYLPQNQCISKLRLKVLEEELIKVNMKYPLNNDCINISTIFFIKKENMMEVGIFIRNTLSKKVCLKPMRLVLKNESGKLISEQIVNFEEIGNLPSYSATPMIVSFNLPKDFVYINEDYIVSFSQYENINAVDSMEVDIEDIPLNLSYEMEQKMQNFKESLDILKKDQISISLFEAKRDTDGGIALNILIRNGYLQEIKLEELPITIVNYNNIIIFKHIFKEFDKIIKISPAKARFIDIKIDGSLLYNTVFDINRCKILFQ